MLNKPVTLTPAIVCAVISAVSYSVSRHNSAVISGLAFILTWIFAGATLSLWWNWVVEVNGQARMQRKIEETYSYDTALIESYAHMAESMSRLPKDYLPVFVELLSATEELGELQVNENNRKQLIINRVHIPSAFMREMINGTDSETHKVPPQREFSSTTNRMYHSMLMTELVRLGMATPHSGNTGWTVPSWSKALAALEARNAA